MPGETHRENALADAVLDDLARTLRLPATDAVRRTLLRLGGIRLRRFLRNVQRFDRETGAHGLRVAAPRFAASLGCRLDCGSFPGPLRTGPLVVAANHPGLADTLALFAAIDRDDLRILAEPNPFLLAMPHVSEHIFYLPEDPRQRGRVWRPMLRHLRSGGALLTFPAGRIEPDPRWLARRAGVSIADWSDSLDSLARAVPGLRVVPTLVAGVFRRDALTHPLTRLGRTVEQRDMIAAYVQLLHPSMGDVPIRVRWGSIVEAAGGGVMSPLRLEMRRMIGGREGE